MINLSKDQSAIVCAPLGHSMQVLASAGAGKTRVLTERVRYIIENTRKDGVIAFTFTNKAAEEMRTRLDDLEELDTRCWIATIHTVAQRILDQYGHAIGLPSELHIFDRNQDRMTIFLQSLRAHGTDIDAFLQVADEKTRKNREKRVQHYLDQFSMVKRELLSEAQIQTHDASQKNFWPMFQAYQSALLESDGIDFDDILVYAHQILLEKPWYGQIYRTKYKHLCVDEAQDLNKAQYEFIKVLCGDQIKDVLFVGDPDQMIYGFNSASQDYLCQHFTQDFSPQQYVLKENYRSSKAVIHLANTLKPGAQIESSFALDGKKHIEAQRDEHTEAAWICDKINELRNLKTDRDIEGEITLSNMVVIARNRFLFQPIEACLKQHQIPYSLNKGERHVEPSSIIGKVLDLGMRIRLNPKDWVNGNKLCATLSISPPEQWGNEDLLRIFAENARKTGLAFSTLQANLLMSIQALDLDRPNILKLSKQYTSQIETLAADATPDAEHEFAYSLQELEDLEHCWVAFKRKGLGDSLSSFRNALALGQLTEGFNPLALTLSTVHTMKGLEKDIVFLLGMCEGIFPDYRANSAQAIEEERNSMFVAITRSKRWIYITYPRQRKMPWGDYKTQQPSRFIENMLL